MQNKELKTCHNILIMDDDEDLLTLFEINLNKLGHQVTVAYNYDEAINQYQTAKKTENPITLAILDLTIPGSLGGKEFASKIRPIDNNIKLIVSSGDTSALEMTNYEDYGFHGSMEKQFNASYIEQIITKVMT